MTPWQLRQAIHSLQTGGVIAYPTEAVFGLGCDPLDPQAVTRLLAIKQRPVSKGLILIAANQAQLAPFIITPSKSIQAKLDATWPGPVTWLLNPRPDVPHWLTGAYDRLAVRVTSHPVAHSLCLGFGGAIISTSANPNTLPPARNLLTLQRYFHSQLDYLLPGRLGTSNKPSEIRDAETGNIVRPG